jgi:hypothetical protein
MAIIKTFRYPVNFVSMFEDPIPGSNIIYFQADAYDKNTLNGIFDYGLVFSTNGQLGTANTFGRSRIDQFAGDGLGGALILNGECTHVRHRIFNTLNDYRNNLDFAPFASMEPGRPAVSSAYYTDGLSNIVIGSYNYSDPTPASNSYASNYVIPYFTKLNTTSRDLATSNFLNATFFAPKFREGIVNVLYNTGSAGVDIAKNIEIKENRFGIEPEITAKLARVPKVRIYEVVISYYGRTYEEGKKIGWKDGFRAIWCILKYRFVK